MVGMRWGCGGDAVGMRTGKPLLLGTVGLLELLALRVRGVYSRILIDGLVVN